jgi:hypothetical protein
MEADGSLGTVLRRQHATAWALLELHLRDLDHDEMLWRPAESGAHVHRVAGEWRADWPEVETYDAGPASIAWLTWHIGFWWSMVLDYSFGDAALQAGEIKWPGPDAAVGWLCSLHQRWIEATDGLADETLRDSSPVRWPMTNRPFADLFAWLNIELMKNAAEIGYARFLYNAATSAASTDRPSSRAESDQDRGPQAPPGAPKAG